MFKSILMTAAAALVATAAASPAHAHACDEWVKCTNGTSLNGASLNSSFTNIRSHQGTSTGAAGFVIDGIELPARTR